MAAWRLSDGALAFFMAGAAVGVQCLVLALACILSATALGTFSMPAGIFFLGIVAVFGLSTFTILRFLFARPSA